MLIRVLSSVVRFPDTLSVYAEICWGARTRVENVFSPADKTCLTTHVAILFVARLSLSLWGPGTADTHAPISPLSLASLGEMVNSLSRSLRTRTTAVETVCRKRTKHYCFSHRYWHWCAGIRTSNSTSYYYNTGPSTPTAVRTVPGSTLDYHRSSAHHVGNHVRRTHNALRGGG